MIHKERVSLFKTMTQGCTIIFLRVGQLPKKIPVQEKVTEKKQARQKKHMEYTVYLKNSCWICHRKTILAQKNYPPHLKNIMVHP